MDSNENPFTIITPEDLTADHAISLFVDGMPGWNIIERPINTLIYGFRGSGKSMALRYMEPDCQIKIHNKKFLELDYFSVYIPIRHGDFYIAELDALKASESYSVRFLESYFLTKVISRILAQFKKSGLLVLMDELDSTNLAKFHNEFLRKLLRYNLWTADYEDTLNESNSTIMARMEAIFDEIHAENTRFLNRITLQRTSVLDVPCNLSFANFFLPFLRELQQVNCIPSCPFYIFLDDIEEANQDFFTVLNSWMAARSNQLVCFKCTLVKNYKTRRTIGGTRITHPHDYLNVNVSDIFATNHLRGFKGRLEKIVRRRLELFNLEPDPQKFFPTDEKQDVRLEEIYQRLSKEYDEKKISGRRKMDNLYRYTRPELFRESKDRPAIIKQYVKPELIKQLGGVSKNRSTYKYCGFDEMSNISGGVIRHFLEAAADMYAEQYKRDAKSKTFTRVRCITPEVQNLSLFDISEKKVMQELWIADDEDYINENEESYEINRRLRNLVHSIGGMCFLCLISDRSERRVFSFAVSDEISRFQRRVISEGLEKEFFHQSSIGNKSGTGRSELFILSRRVAPSFHLDPLNFAAYKWMTADQLELAMTDVNSFIHKFRKRLVSGDEAKVSEVSQLPLWPNEDT